MADAIGVRVQFEARVRKGYGLGEVSAKKERGATPTEGLRCVRKPLLAVHLAKLFNSSIDGQARRLAVVMRHVIG